MKRGIYPQDYRLSISGTRKGEADLTCDAGFGMKPVDGAIRF